MFYTENFTMRHYVGFSQIGSHFIIIIHLLHLVTRMVTLGKMEEYCPCSEEWPQYIKYLEFFLIANKVTDDALKRAPLLSVIGPQIFKLLWNLITPAKPGDKTYPELVEVLTNHFSPKQSKIVQR